MIAPSTRFSIAVVLLSRLFTRRIRFRQATLCKLPKKEVTWMKSAADARQYHLVNHSQPY